MASQNESQMENSTSAPLPIDILLDIFIRLPLSDIASLRQVRHSSLITQFFIHYYAMP